MGLLNAEEREKNELHITTQIRGEFLWICNVRSICFSNSLVPHFRAEHSIVISNDSASLRKKVSKECVISIHSHYR